MEYKILSVCENVCKYYVNLPFLQVLLSFRNINPASQAHSCLSCFLLQIWLQPPLSVSSQGCTKYKKCLITPFLYLIIIICKYAEKRLPFVQVFLSFCNANPFLQAHSYFCPFFLLQIWLQPPLFFVPQGCTRKGNINFTKNNNFTVVVYTDVHMTN